MRQADSVAPVGPALRSLDCRGSFVPGTAPVRSRLDGHCRPQCVVVTTGLGVRAERGEFGGPGTASSVRPSGMAPPTQSASGAGLGSSRVVSWTLGFPKLPSGCPATLLAGWLTIREDPLRRCLNPAKPRPVVRLIVYGACQRRFYGIVLRYESRPCRPREALHGRASRPRRRTRLPRPGAFPGLGEGLPIALTAGIP